MSQREAEEEGMRLTAESVGYVTFPLSCGDWKGPLRSSSPTLFEI